jgi:peptidoglycan/xylan/chitin deacetylase (PgdA/CDA1 family)
MLGQQWFADRVWTFDYPNKRLLLRADGDLPEGKAEHRVSLGFKASPSGKRAMHFPRIQVSIDGEAVDLLFDTGASTELTEAALSVLKDRRPAVRATSFITANLFEKWRKRHPEWRVIEGAEARSNEAMIEVPKVVVAGHTVGPVWFTRRADKNFHEYMSQWMDKRIEGALGGNALYYFRVTVDYPRSVAVFEK